VFSPNFSSPLSSDYTRSSALNSPNRFPQAPSSTLVDRPQRKRGKLPKETTDFLKAWIHRHSDHPYPSEEEKKQLCHATNLSMSQVSNWMINVSAPSSHLRLRLPLFSLPPAIIFSILFAIIINLFNLSSYLSIQFCLSYGRILFCTLLCFMSITDTHILSRPAVVFLHPRAALPRDQQPRHIHRKVVKGRPSATSPLKPRQMSNKGPPD
jgi:hypothetical protein